MTASHEWVRSLLKRMHEEVEFDQKKHRYTVGGEWRPGVTSILGVLHKNLENWAGNLAVDECRAIVESASKSRNGFIWEDLLLEIDGARDCWRRESKRTAGIGKAVHAEAEYHINRSLGLMMKPPKPNAEARAVWEKCLEPWLRKNGFKPIASEQRCHHPIEKYAGTADLYASFNDFPLALVDFKTCEDEAVDRPPYESHELQLTGYMAPAQYVGIEDIVGFIVKVPRSGKREPRSWPVFWSDANWQAFRDLHSVFRWKVKRENGGA